MRRALFSTLSLLTLYVLVGCGGSSNPGSGTPPSSTGTGVTVSPQTATVSRGGTQQFTATITGATDQTVQWQVDGVTGGDATHGLISSGGVYIAPTMVPNPASVTVTAQDFADATKTGTATVTVQTGSSVSVVITGSSQPISVQTFATHQFVAVVTGTTNTAVTWQVNGVAGGAAKTGTISASGVYTAPGSVPVSSSPNNDGQTTDVIVTAVSQADATASDSADVVIVPPQASAQSLPVLLGVSGGNAKDTSNVGSQTFCCGGTLGSLVSRGGKQYILSDNHVLARSDLGTAASGATPGDAIVQPGLIDNNCSTSGTNTVANLSQFSSLENGAAPKVDAALAQVVAGEVNPAGTILQLGATTSGGVPTDGAPHAGSGVAAAIGRGVAKSGRSTGITCSTVLSISTQTSVDYQKGCGTGTKFTVQFANQVDVDSPGGSFTGQGDSGSLLVTQDTADPVGLMFAGSDRDTVVNPISDVLLQMADPSTHEQPVFVGSAATHAVAACSLPGVQAATAARLSAEKPRAAQAVVQQAGSVRDAHAPELMAHPEVQAVGVGASYDNPDEPAILFFVTKGQPRTNIPSQVDGVRTRIIEGELFPRRGTISAAESVVNEQAVAPPQVVYAISDAEAARAKTVHAAHADELMKQPGVQGVGVTSSMDAPGEAALMIFVIRGVPHNPIPGEIDGLRTRVRESSRFRAGFGGPQRIGVCSMPGAKGARSPATMQTGRP